MEMLLLYTFTLEQLLICYDQRGYPIVRQLVPQDLQAN